MIHKITKPKRQSINITINLSNINNVNFNTNDKPEKRKDNKNGKVEGVGYEDLVGGIADPDQGEDNEDDFGHQNTNEEPVPGDTGNGRNEDAIPKSREEINLQAWSTNNLNH